MFILISLYLLVSKKYFFIFVLTYITTIIMRKTIIAIISALIITALPARAQESTALWRAENQIAQALEKCANTGDDARKTAYAAGKEYIIED